MTRPTSRRTLLLTAASLQLAAARRSWAGEVREPAADRLAALEASSGGHLGVAALNSADGSWLVHRGDERFPLCSTFKLILASAILDRSAQDDDLLQRRIVFARAELVTYSPITQRHLDHGMTIAELCAAALQYSDNTAANLLMKQLGGPAAVTAYAKTLGDREFRLDRWETELNTAIPGDPRDTSTPAGMARSLHRVALGDALRPDRCRHLLDWLRGNTTGATRIRAGVPADWPVGDKTGTGDYGTTNDVGVLWPPSRPPIVLALYFTQPREDAKPRNDVLAAATGIVARAFAA